MTATEKTVAGLHVGTSGWSYPSWRPGFYPQGTKPEEFLKFYASRFSTVELNTTGYRLPAEEQFRRWAAAVPDGFRYAPKLNGHARAPVGTFSERVSLLGDRLGPIRVLIKAARDEGLLALLGGSFPPGASVAWDFRHESWRDVELPPGTVAVDDLERDAPFRYVRLREPPYDEAALAGWAARLRPQLEDGIELYVYFKHEDEPSAPLYAERLVELLR
jgi:uncharacterized protein YecE (DUF72 family)